MPIYMDRHEIPEEITAAHVAQMHREDLKIEHLYGCKGMTYWCDEKRRTAFCLIQAPNKKAIQDMHNHAHGEVPHRIIEVESSIVESFLGRIEDPEKSQKTELNIINDPAFRTIMVIGLRKVSFLGVDPKLMDREFHIYNKSILQSIEKFLGRIVRQKSGYFLLSFNSVTNAVLCAQEIHSNINDTSKGFNWDYKLNIGLHAGVPVTEKDGIFEDTIKMAERFCEMVHGKIVISPEVRELYESENMNVKLNHKNIKTLSVGEEKFVNLLMDYTEKEWTNAAFNSNDFSKNLGFSKSQLYRKMIGLTGKSPNNFIKDYRLEKALQLLDKKANNISEIAFGTGFNSPAYFSKCFMDNFGILPSKYIQNYAV
ncbi:nickel-binding protein [Arenibacter echinorum]|uniref:Helix-turn-helix protein n=1 Tax=Arenibacter echinorum TaxID=440515 RepID=A0A327R7N1_9FLAO|nr:nickel-binding protein [Arenibacter echinorum]RAJ12839.1 helix-turn-helix protein [Arenibacter echinorum]